MSTPYREPSGPEPVARWPLRGPRLATSIGAAVVIVLALGWPTFLFARVPMRSPLVAVALGAGVAIVTALLRGGEARRLAGGRGEIRLYEDCLEVPAEDGETLRLSLERLEHFVEVRRMSFNFVPVSDERIVTLRDGACERRLSSRLFAGDLEVDRLLDELRRLC